MKKLIIQFREWLYERRLRSAKREADKLAAKTGKKYLVLVDRGGSPVVVAKQELKKKYKTPAFGWDRLAIYTAFPKRK